ncbi:PQQ-binding-like beta-propeller repeat protein [Micromonospora sp. NPDC049523]|uniref:outer membrane protein assembly factor BamB family protein n=1 Tax=Micromonospora sp. NPDC049523 TaxID=3155921 RepID=UPI003412F913
MMYETSMHRGDAARRGWYGSAYGDRPAWSDPWLARATPKPPPVPAQPAKGGFWSVLGQIGKGLVELGSAWVSMNNPSAPSPVVAGSRVVGWNNRNVLCCWDALTGGLRWQAGDDTGGPQVLATPSVADGHVVVADLAKLSGLDLETGASRWSRTLPGTGSTPLLQGGAAYVVDDTGGFGAYRIQDGQHLWSAQLANFDGQRTSTAAAPSSDGSTVFVAGEFGLSAIDPIARRLLWTQGDDDLSFTTPAVFGGCVYVVSNGGVVELSGFRTSDYQTGFVSAVRADNGRELWSRELSAEATVSSVAVSSGLVVLGDDRGVVHAFDTTNGRPRWTYTTGGAVWSAPSVAGNTVFVGSKDGHLYALDIGTGRLRWRYGAADAIVAAPAIGHGFVFVYDVTGSLYAVDAATGRGPALSNG